MISIHCFKHAKKNYKVYLTQFKPKQSPLKVSAIEKMKLLKDFRNFGEIFPQALLACSRLFSCLQTVVHTVQLQVKYGCKYSIVVSTVWL